MFVVTVFGLLLLLPLAITLTIISTIKPSVVFDNKKMKWNRLKIAASGSLLCFVSLILCVIFAPDDLIQNRASSNDKQETSAPVAQKGASYGTNPDIKKYKTVADLFEDYENSKKPDEYKKHYDYYKYEVISPTEIVLYREFPASEDSLLILGDLSFTARFLILEILPHVDIEQLTVHVKPRFYDYSYFDNIKNRRVPVPNLSKYNFTIRLDRKILLAYLKEHFNINSYDELVETRDEIDGKPTESLKGTTPSEKYESILRPISKDEIKKTEDLINRFTLDESQLKNEAKLNIKKFKTVAECIDASRMYYKEYKIISPTEIVINNVIPLTEDIDFVKKHIKQAAIFSLLDIFTYVDIDKITVHFKPQYDNHLKSNKKITTPDLNKYAIILKANRKDVLAYLTKHFNINSFDELFDTVDDMTARKNKAFIPSEKYDEILFPISKDGDKKTWAFINTFTVK